MADVTKYKKHELRDHIYDLPDTYIGSVEDSVADTFVYSDSAKTMVRKTLHYNPGLYKIFDEIIVNALDQCTRLKTVEDARPVKTIKIEINQETGVIEVWNDGDGIPVEKHPKYDIYVPELIFGELLTSINYDKEEEKLVGGKHGYGAKLTNIFSKEFTIETVDHHRKKIYTQTWTNNMRSKGAATVKAYSKIPYTMVRFLPDYARFGLKKGITADMYDLFRRRAFDACACTDASVTVFFNGEKLEFKTFEKYIDLFLGDKTTQARVYEQANERWEVVASYSDSGFQQISFVNGINTLRGGKHVDYIANQITKGLAEMIQSKKKKEVKQQHLKDNLSLFIKCSIVNPSFDSQTKETLTTQVNKFGSKCELSDKFFKSLFKCGIVEKAVAITEFHEEKKEKKTDGKKQSRVIVPNLDDANRAGTKDSAQCTLILTEGLSARTMAIAGLSMVGRDYYGVFPLKGKIMNVKDMKSKSVSDNEELSNLKKILGLEHAKDYKDISSLRYGRIMALTDSDTDGSHIKGLLINAFQTLWPSLYKMPGFLISMVTPIVKVEKGKEKQAFYTVTDYQNWRKAQEEKPGGLRGWTIKYYKGLGTSTSAEAKEYFGNMQICEYQHTDHSDEAIDLAFNKKRADDRKEWLATYDKDRVLDFSHHNQKGVGGSLIKLPFEEFVHKELIHFSQADLERSIASVVDGLKTSQRKILYSCFKRRLYNNEIRVAQLAGYVSEVSAYHHGEASLQGAIVNLAQDYVGANNIPLLQPIGQFGSRIQMGKDAASARYIHTHLTPLARKLFREEDFPILNYLDDDGYPVEPEYYTPILPLALINGALGIGTGYSMTVPSFNPSELLDICSSICSAMLSEKDDTLEMAKRAIDEVPIPELKPWYLGFTGTFEEKQGSKINSFVSKGVYHWVDQNTIEVTELPIQKGMESFKDRMEKLLAEGNPTIKDFTPLYTEKRPCFRIRLQPGARERMEPEEIEDLLQLSSSDNMSLNNVNLFNSHGVIHHYDSLDELIREWALVRIVKYYDRKRHQLDRMEQQRILLDARVKFLTLVTTGELKVANRPIAELEQDLMTRKFPKLCLSDDGTTSPEEANKSYDYLVNMQIRKLTKEEKMRLEEQLRVLLEEVKLLKKTPVADIWLRELGEFEKEWTKYQTAYLDSINNEGEVKKPAAKKPRQK